MGGMHGLAVIKIGRCDSCLERCLKWRGPTDAAFVLTPAHAVLSRSRQRFMQGWEHGLVFPLCYMASVVSNRRRWYVLRIADGQSRSLLSFPSVSTALISPLRRSLNLVVLPRQLIRLLLLSPPEALSDRYGEEGLPERPWPGQGAR